MQATLPTPFSGPDDEHSLQLLRSSPAGAASTPVARARHAVCAAQALARLAGMLPSPHATPVCGPARSALGALLTETLASRLADADPRAVLALLNGTQETCKVGHGPLMHQPAQPAQPLCVRVRTLLATSTAGWPSMPYRPRRAARPPRA